jgi:GTP-binding protein Era
MFCTKKESRKRLSFDISSGSRTRTYDLWVMSPTSCQLLHPAILECKGKKIVEYFNYFCKNIFKTIILSIYNLEDSPKTLHPTFTDNHKAGFISIIGKPNVGKSTLMNELVGERLSIITSKAQTTRHRIMGIVNGELEGTQFQMVYSDTPGIIKPQYELHNSMMEFVRGSLADADVILFVTDIYEKFDEEDVIEKLKKTDVPVFLVINKVDLATPEKVEQKTAHWKEVLDPAEILVISALQGLGLGELLVKMIEYLPTHPPYFPKDELTDKPERFFAAEIIREKILQNYRKEIPYSCEIVITEFKEKEDIVVVRAEIYVERATQRAILLGHKGERIKKVGIEARESMETFFQKKVFLEQYIKVEPDWRIKKDKLRRFGY